MKPLEVHYYENHRIEIYPDTDPVDPRDRNINDPMGTLWCWHRHYDLGDEDGKPSSDKILAWFDEHPKLLTRFNGLNTGQDKWNAIEYYLIHVLKAAVILRVYGMDHSGMRIKTTPFNDRWDSGQLGFIWMTKEQVLHEYGGKVLSMTRKKRAEHFLKGEVEDYDAYQSGSVYGYKIFGGIDAEADRDEPDTSGEEIEDHWGYYDTDAALKEAQLNVDAINGRT